MHPLNMIFFANYFFPDKANKHIMIRESNLNLLLTSLFF